MVAPQPEPPAWTREHFVRELVRVPGIGRDLVRRWAELDEPTRLQLVRELNDGSSDALGEPRPADELTPRELEVVASLVERGSTWDAADALGMSEDSVRQHLESVLTKLRAQSRTHAVATLVRDGLLPAPPRGA